MNVYVYLDICSIPSAAVTVYSIHYTAVSCHASLVGSSYACLDLGSDCETSPIGDHIGVLDTSLHQNHEATIFGEIMYVIANGQNKVLLAQTKN